MGPRSFLARGLLSSAPMSAILTGFFTGVPGACAGSSPGFHEKVLGCYQGCCSGGERAPASLYPGQEAISRQGREGGRTGAPDRVPAQVQASLPLSSVLQTQGGRIANLRLDWAIE